MAVKIQMKGKVENELYYSEQTSYGVYSILLLEDYNKLESKYAKDCESEIKNKSKIDTLTKNFKEVFEEDFLIPTKKRFKIVGQMQKLEIGLEYTFVGEISFNKKYKNYNIEIDKAVSEKPKDDVAIRSFLGTIMTKLQMNEILNKYPNIIDLVIEGKPLSPEGLKRISEEKLSKIRERIYENYGISELLSYFSKYDLTYNEIKKISTLKENAELVIKLVEENPYVLTIVEGIGFAKADSIALKIKPESRQSYTRAYAFLLHVLKEKANGDGDTLVYRGKILDEGRNKIYDSYKNLKEILDIDKLENISELPNMSELYRENKIFRYTNDEGEELIGLDKYYYLESNILKKLNYLNDSNFVGEELTEEELNELVYEVEKNQGFNFTKEQLETIKSANSIKNNVMLISGSAGTGKTSVVACVIKVIDKMIEKAELKNKVKLCALSAKASLRMSEVTGKSASTIHRFVFSEIVCQHNKDSKENGLGCTQKYSAIVADEFSMNNVEVTNMLIDIVSAGTKFIMVFDFAQLPAIGSGSIAYDLLHYSNFLKFKYTKVHRQAEKSGILSGANKVRVNKMPIDSPNGKFVAGELKDMYYAFSQNKEKLRDYAINQFFKILEKEDTTIDDISIIVPRKAKCINSTSEINKIIQDRYLPFGRQEEVNTKFKTFRVGDKVIHRKNNPVLNVYNGELGKVVSIVKNKKGEASGCVVKYIDYNAKKYDVKLDNETIPFDDEENINGKVYKYVTYAKSDLLELELAYALTIHSFQGSQAKYIIGILDMSHFMLLDSTLLYTLMTRAEKKCMLLAEPKAYTMCIKHNKVKKRTTFLEHILNGKFKAKDIFKYN